MKTFVDLLRSQVAQGVGHGEDGVDLVVGLVPRPVEIGLIHVIDMELFEVSCQFNSLTHDRSPIFY